MSGTDVLGTVALSGTCGAANGCSKSSVALLTADMNGDGQSDVLWLNHVTGELSAWLLNGTSVASVQAIGNVPLAYRAGNRIAGVVDANGDGHADVAFFDAAHGAVAFWLLDGAGRVLDRATVPLKCFGACADELQDVHPVGFATLAEVQRQGLSLCFRTR